MNDIEAGERTAAFRKLMGRHASGVTVLTTRAGSVDHAMTANTLTSVSLEPLLVLVCIETDARFHDAVIEAGAFGASILTAEQRAVSDWFATRGRPLVGQLAQTPHTHGPATGVALLDGALGSLEARVAAVHPAGDHSIIVGEVVGLTLPDEVGPALLYYRGSYTGLP